MRKIYTESPLAKVLLALSSCHTITLGPFVLSKRKAADMTQAIRNHECIHARQWCETTLLAGFFVFLLMLFFDLHPAWMLSTAVVFYIWYGVEYLIRLLVTFNADKAYRGVSFEQEAYDGELDPNYLENSHYFAWIHHLKKAFREGGRAG